MTLMVSRRGVRSIPRSAGANFSKGFFLAFMMLGREAYLGSVREGVEAAFPCKSSIDLPLRLKSEVRVMSTRRMANAPTTHRRSVVIMTGNVLYGMK